MFLKNLIIIFVSFFVLLSCSKDSPLSLPLVAPPVRAATPEGFKSGTSVVKGLRSLDSADFKSRFFSAGPTNIFTILAAIDNRIGGFNTDGGSHACSSQTPVAYTVTPFGQSVTMYGQCAQTGLGSYSADPGLVIFGQDSTKVFYLYTANGASWTAAIATPITGNDGKYAVHAWIGVGYSNGTSGGSNAACSKSWDNCSYGVVEIDANEVTKKFEMAVAGMGIGYCGAQYVSDGTNIYGKGSTDMGTTCSSTDTICVSASNASTVATCTDAQKVFSLPAIGRRAAASSGLTDQSIASWGATAYPSSANLTIDGTASDALRFGPTTVPAGIGTY